MNDNEIIVEEMDNRYENVTISNEDNRTMDMDEENPWFIVAANVGAA